MDKVELFAGLALGLWTFFKSASFLYFRRTEKLERLYEALEIGVSAAWTRVVKPWYEKNGKDSPLPTSIREQAERVAVDEAEKADKIVRKFPREILKATLKMAVEEAKRRGGK